LDLVLEAIKASIHAVLLGTGERPGEICGLRHFKPNALRKRPANPFLNAAA
jgi:hypothetical protein